MGQKQSRMVRWAAANVTTRAAESNNKLRTICENVAVLYREIVKADWTSDEEKDQINIS